VGDEVFGFLLHANPTVHDGSWTELITVPQDMFIGQAPRGVDLATRADATVVAPALPEDEIYLRELGVNELLPRNGDLAAAARERHPDGFDAVLDLVNYAPDVPAALAKEGGRVASPTGAAGEGPGRTMVMAVPTPENLERLARRLTDGTLRVPIHATYELAQAPDALTALGTTHTRGKLAIHIQ
jgi:NADPH:quinone reductase-like Zn-dependent oxidoreductase